MKIGYRDIEGFVKAPAAHVRAILVYGPDAGLVRERAEIMGKTVVPDLSDPFQVTSLSTDAIKDDPAVLGDEANAISMMGGKRLIRIKGAGEAVTVPLKAYLENPNDDAVIILETGNLTPKSGLRKLCEKEKNAAAVPCYVEDERDVSRTIADTLRGHSIRADGDAIAYLAHQIVGDRERVRSELEKICLFKHGDSSPLTLSDVNACTGGGGELSYGELTNAVASRNRKAAIETYHQLLANGENTVTIVRSLQSHFKRLHYTRAMMENGDSIDGAMKKLYPPIFFKEQSAFKSQIQAWNLPKTTAVLRKFMELEKQCKSTGYDPDILCAQAILAVSAR